MADKPTKKSKSRRVEGGAAAATCIEYVHYPIKNFRNADEYPAPESVSRWRWEFLRRDKEYQSAHRTFGAHARPPAECRSFGLRFFPDPRQDNAYEVFRDGGTLVELPTFEWLEKWQKVPGFDAERGMQMLLSTLTELQAQGSTIATIDVTQPLEPQFQSIRESIGLMLERTRQAPAIKRERRHEWLTYLRALDAEADGADLDEAASVLYPESENEYPDFAGRKRLLAALERSKLLCQTFARKRFVPEN